MVGRIGQQDAPVSLETLQVLGHLAVMRLVHAQFQNHGPVLGIDHGMNFYGQSATRTSRAAIVFASFLRGRLVPVV